MIAAVGFASKVNWLAKAGVVTFLCSFAVWGFANGGAFAWAMKEGIRTDGVRSLTANPWSAAMFLVLMVFFLGFGSFIVWFIATR